MATKKELRGGEGRGITSERALRLYQLIRLLGSGPQTRRALSKKLRVDVRGFYRDLELLREAGIAIPLVDQQYSLGEKLALVVEKLPLPDPHLTLGEARILARGAQPPIESCVGKSRR